MWPVLFKSVPGNLIRQISSLDIACGSKVFAGSNLLIIISALPLTKLFMTVARLLIITAGRTIQQSCTFGEVIKLWH